ncbi:MAG: restriction endonuclease subunit S [Ignavibacteriales bacterium]|nr:restriction endonuclease subunit S [Ignavibacteriales bacterium]MCF8316169.1 restriction endonuclease subunit S [Ignavibacteriales bacterium]MCF8436671.1 restriction endonuclease subunit S [Ignavibacteriales bacterium]
MKQNWEIKKLSEIGKVFNGNSINEKVKKDNYTGLDEGLPFIATKDVGFDSIIDYENGVKIPFTEKEQFKIAPANTPLICAEGGSAGRKIGFTNQDVCFGNKLFALVPNKNVDSKFLFYYYFNSSFQKYFSTEMAGIIGGVSMNKFKDIEIPLPPLPEQQRIVSILDEAFAALAKAKANAEQNLQNAKELFESYLQGVFEKKGENWEEKTLGEVCSLITDGKHGDCENEENSGYYFLSAKDVRNGTLLFENARQITKSGFEETHKRTNLKPGDICMVNTGATIGRISFAPEDPRTYKATFQKSVAVIKTIPTLIDNNFCCYILQSDLKKLVKVSSGTAVPNLLLGDLKRHKINLPKSKTEQQTIVRQLDALRAETQKLEAVYQKKIDDLEELKKTILQKAFAGELKVSEPLIKAD